MTVRLGKNQRKLAMIIFKKSYYSGEAYGPVYAPLIGSSRSHRQLERLVELGLFRWLTRPGSDRERWLAPTMKCVEAFCDDKGNPAWVRHLSEIAVPAPVYRVSVYCEKTGASGLGKASTPNKGLELALAALDKDRLVKADGRARLAARRKQAAALEENDA